MKKLYKHIIIFILPFVIFAFVLFIMPYSKKFAYHKITGGCSIEYAYQRMVEDTTHLDVAYIGSSKTHCAVNDLLIRFLYEHEYNTNITVANISFCGTGRNLQYSIIKELFKNKKPKALVIEVRETEDPNGHISNGVIADAADIITAPLYRNKNYFEDIFSALKSRYDYLIWGNSTDLTYHGPKFGFGPNNKDADSNYLQFYYLQKKELFATKNTFSSTNQFPFYYLNKIIQLANENQCKIYFLYLPSFGFIANHINEIEYYNLHGTVITPPINLLSDHNYWSDQNHLKRNGADSLSCWLADKMIEELKTLD